MQFTRGLSVKFERLRSRVVSVSSCSCFVLPARTVQETNNGGWKMVLRGSVSSFFCLSSLLQSWHPNISPTGLPPPALCPGGLSPKNVIPYRWMEVSVDCTSLSPHIDRIKSKIEPTDPTTSSAVFRPCRSLTAEGNTSLVQHTTQHNTTRIEVNFSLWLAKHCVATALNGGEWSASWHGRLIQEERTSDYISTGLRTGLEELL